LVNNFSIVFGGGKRLFIVLALLLPFLLELGILISQIVPERKLSFSPISASGSTFNPRNTQCIPAVKIFAFLDLNKKSQFSFGH